MAKLELTKNVTLLDENLELIADTRIVNYIIEGSPSLINNINVSLVGTPIEGMTMNAYYVATPTLSTYTISLFGNDITAEASEKIKVECIYAGGQWIYSFSNFNTYELEPDSISTVNIQDAAITTDKIADDAITPSKLSSTYEVAIIKINLDADVKSNRVMVPYKAVLEKVRFYCTDSFDTSANRIEFRMNINGLGLSTQYPESLVTAGVPLVEGDYGTIVSGPPVGTDEVGVSTSDYVEITLTQTPNLGGAITFFLILKRTDA